MDRLIHAAHLQRRVVVAQSLEPVPLRTDRGINHYLRHALSTISLPADWSHSRPNLGERFATAITEFESPLSLDNALNPSIRFSDIQMTATAYTAIARELNSERTGIEQALRFCQHFTDGREDMAACTDRRAHISLVTEQIRARLKSLFQHEYLPRLRQHHRQEIKAYTRNHRTHDITTDMTCGICLETLPEASASLKSEDELPRFAVRLPCHHSHTVHSDCLEPWMLRKVSCPYDRSKLFTSRARLTMVQFREYI